MRYFKNKDYYNNKALNNAMEMSNALRDIFATGLVTTNKILKKIGDGDYPKNILLSIDENIMLITLKSGEEIYYDFELNKLQ